MPLTKEEINEIAKASAQAVLEGMHRYVVEYKEPETIEQGLQDSMIEEHTAANWYRKRAENAASHVDSTTYLLYKHIADEEDRHFDEFQKRKLGLATGNPSTHTVNTARSDFWDLTTTDMPLYDQMIKNPDYFRKGKGLEFEIIYMTPDIYMMKSADIQHSTLEAQYRELERALVETYRDKMLRGVKFPIPVLDYAEGVQEGRNRAIAAKEAGATTIPVMVVTRVSVSNPGSKAPESGNPAEKMPRVNPHASALERDRQLRKQLRWLKEHGFKSAREAQDAGY